MNTPLSLYNKSLLTVINNENLPINNLPKPILYDVGLLQSLHQKLNQRKQTYNLYYNSLSYIGELTWDCLTCEDCGYSYTWPIETGYCFTHSQLIDTELEVQKELKHQSVNAAIIYTKEKI